VRGMHATMRNEGGYALPDRRQSADGDGRQHRLVFYPNVRGRLCPARTTTVATGGHGRRGTSIRLRPCCGAVDRNRAHGGGRISNVHGVRNETS
jgi:hypothetical protein